uniref:Secreted protein n=1 Tax=Streptomyces sp. NBC_00049 TaxID=2903617 RepID=A0AAU2K2Y8_9ACTN
MRTVRTLTAALLAAAAALTVAGTAVADTPSATPSPTKSPAQGEAAPTEAGTGFRTATAFRPGQQAKADASTGDYLYWVLPIDAQQRVTVNAKVTLPESATRHGAATWRIDVYDGLRRRQPCTYGTQSRAAAKEAGSVELSCTLRTVRAGAEQWANDPLPGSYYVRLTVGDLPEEDLGLPVRASVEAAVTETGGAHAVDGALAAPLVPATVTGALREPEDGWSGGWWSDRWLWTAAGGVLGALAGIFGYSLTRGAGRPSRVPPGA